jgi:hypothetical protein
MTTWEVSVARGTAARLPQLRETQTGEEMAAVLAAILKSGQAALIIRTDQTPEAKRAKWEADFYDIDKAGRRRRRYKRPVIEKEWEEMIKQVKREARDERKRYQAREVPTCPLHPRGCIEGEAPARG